MKKHLALILSGFMIMNLGVLSLSFAETKDVLFQKANQYAKLNQWDQAIQTYKAILAQHPKDKSAHIFLANSYYHKGMPDEAIAAYREAIALDPANGELHASLGYSYAQKGLSDQAIQEYLEAIRLDPNQAFAYAQLGDQYRAKGLLDQSIEAEKKALALNPKHGEAQKHKRELSNAGTPPAISGTASKHGTVDSKTAPVSASGLQGSSLLPKAQKQSLTPEQADAKRAVSPEDGKRIENIQALEETGDRDQDICDVQDAYDNYMKALALASASQERVRLRLKATDALLRTLPSVIRFMGRDDRITNRSREEQDQFRQMVREHLYKAVTDRPTKVRRTYPPGFSEQDAALVGTSPTIFYKLLVGSEEPSHPSLKNNKFATSTGSYHGGYEAALRQRILASSGNLLPGDVARMALDVTNNNYPMAMLTAHNLLKNVAYIGRNKLENYHHYLDPATRKFMETKSTPAEVKTYQNPNDYLKPEGDVAAKLRNLRRSSCYATNGSDKMGQWYHIFAVMTAASWKDISYGYSVVLGENGLRVGDHLWAETTGGKAHFSKLDPDKTDYDFMAAGVAKDIGLFLGDPLMDVLPQEKPEVSQCSADCQAEREYFQKTVFSISQGNTALPPKLKEQLDQMNRQLDEQEEGLRNAQQFLKENTVRVLELEKLADDSVMPCRELQKGKENLDAIMNRMAQDGDQVEQLYGSAQKLASRCADPAMLQKSQVAYQQAEQLVQKIVAQENSVLTMVPSLTRLAAELTLKSDKIADVRQSLMDLSRQKLAIENAVSELQHIQGSDVSAEDSADQQNAIQGQIWELTQRLEAFRQKYQGKVPADMLEQCTGTLQLYINGLQARGDSREKSDEQLTAPMDALKARAEQLLKEATSLSKTFSDIDRTLNHKLNDSCLGQPVPDLNQQKEKAGEIRAIAIAAQRTLGKGYQEMEGQCKARLNGSTGTQRCQGASCPPTRSSAKPVKPKSLEDDNSTFNKKAFPAYVIVFLNDTIPEKPHEGLMLYKSPPVAGMIHFGDGTGGMYHYAAVGYGPFSDFASVCAVIRGHNEKSVSFPGAYYGETITCEHYAGAVVPPKHPVKPIKNKANSAQPSTSGNKPSTASQTSQSGKSPLDRPDPWNDSRIQGYIDAWLRSAKPNLDPDKYPGDWRFDEWARPIKPGITTSGPPQTRHGWDRYHELWEIRDRLPSSNFCTMGEFIQRRVSGKELSGCAVAPKLGSTPKNVPSQSTAVQRPQTSKPSQESGVPLPGHLGRLAAIPAERWLNGKPDFHRIPPKGMAVVINISKDEHARTCMPQAYHLTRVSQMYPNIISMAIVYGSAAENRQRTQEYFDRLGFKGPVALNPPGLIFSPEVESYMVIGNGLMIEHRCNELWQYLPATDSGLAQPKK